MALLPWDDLRILLAVHGARAQVYHVALAIELSRGIPNAALWVVPIGGHGPIFGPAASTFRAAALAHLAGSPSA